jgi:hypothetical protein
LAFSIQPDERSSNQSTCPFLFAIATKEECWQQKEKAEDNLKNSQGSILDPY